MRWLWLWLLLAWTGGAAGSPATALAGVGVEPRPGAPLPPDLILRDADGAPLRLGAVFGAAPALLAPVWYGCRNVCGVELRELAYSLKSSPLRPGVDYRLIVFSIDPRDGVEAARQQRALLLERLGRPAATAGLYILTGDETAIRRLTAAIGYRYAYDPDTDQYAHPTGLVALTPDGRIARYLPGLLFPPQTLAAALRDAGAGRTTAPVAALITRCYIYDPVTGRYTLSLLKLMRYLGGAFALLVGLAVAALMWRERQVGQ